MKKIGVVIPIYNTDKYLKECIASVINQTYKNIEIALVDDGSTDDSGKICDEYAKKDDRIKVIHQNNNGKLAARYNGAKILDCDYLTFVDSDDFIALNTYETFTEQMEQDIDVISWQIIRYRNKNNQWVSNHNFPCKFYNNEQYKIEILPYIIWLLEKINYGIDPAVWNKLIKKDLVLKALESAQTINVSYGDDMAIVYPILKNIQTLFLSEKNLYYHRQRSLGEIPPYFKDKDFFKKLYILYDYLSNCFEYNSNFISQLDAFYTNSINLRNNYFSNTYSKKNTYLFPFEKVPAKQNIIIYGAGLIGNIYYNQVKSLNYANKILWVDKNYARYNDTRITNIEYLKNVTDYDYIVIAIENEGIAKDVIDYISNIATLSNIKIVWNIYKY